eukprot:PITA_03221
MEIPPSQEQNHGHAQPKEDSGQTTWKFKGIQLREWGKWISEIRIPRSREKIYLGSYKTVEQAAQAFDAAMYCLRVPNAKFNFHDYVPSIPSAFSLSPPQIQASSVSDMELSNDAQRKSEDLAFWKSLFAEPDGPQYLNLGKIPSIDEELAWELIPISEEEVVVDIRLWNFEDI